MIDQHVHSEFSVDSKVPIDEYLKKLEDKKCEVLTLTDHFDFLKNLRNDNLDKYFEKYDNFFSMIKKRNDSRIKVGIEVGYNRNTVSEVNKLLYNYNFSLVLLSIHDNDEENLEYYYASRKGLSTDSIVEMYISQIEDAIQSEIDFDVFTHFGYVFRYLDGDFNILDYVDNFDNALKLLAKNNKALELNTGCIRYETKNIVEFYTRLFTKFKAFGGKYVSVGSDCHDINSYCFGFDLAYAIVKKAGFDYITHIVDRQFTLVKIPNLNLVDQHCHTNYSPDSNLSIEYYISRMELFDNSYLNITDHLDLLENIDKHKHHDYFKSFDDLFKLNLDSRVKIGVEVGYNNTTVSKAIEVLNKYNFSLVLLSIHENDENKIRYSRAQKSSLEFDKVVDLYVSQMEEAISSNIDFDVLAHIPFIFRYVDSSIDPLMYVDKFNKVLKILVEKKKAIEYNTSCVYYFSNSIQEFYTLILKKYISYGGKYISIGSDSHKILEHSRDFIIATKYLKSIGVNEVVQIKDRKFTLVSIGD